MSVLEIDINRETRRAQIFRARFHAAIGDSAPLEDIPADDLTAAHHRLQTRTRQGDPQGWAWVHTTLVEAELRRRHKRPGNGPVDIPTPCGNDEKEAPSGILDGDRSGHSNGAANTGAALATGESRKGIHANG